ncbi:MAG: SDR family NAD(P)-dependent oxidoreductase, partial [Pseudonocardiaceae bacterium]
HSQGEIAAAYVSGALSLEDAATVVALRSRALRALCGEGSMMSLSLSRAEVEELVVGWDGVGVAAVNGPATTVISGPVAGLQGVAEECERREVRARWIPVDYASHSEHVERIEAQLLTDLAGIAPQRGKIPFYSTVTGERLDATGLDAAYWYRNLRQTVLFSDTIEALAEAGQRAFVEVSAHPVLIPALHAILQDVESVVVGSLRRDEGGLDRLVRSAAEAYVRGVEIDWAAVLPAGRTVLLPTYAFQRERYWLERTALVESSDVDGAAFWAAVERGDAEALSVDLGVAEDTPLRELVPALSAWRRRRDQDAVLDQWRYRVSWRVLPKGTAGAPGRWLVVRPSGAAGDVADRIANAIGAHVLELGAPDRSAWAELLGTHSDCTGIVSLMALTDDHSAGVISTVTLVQAVLDAGLNTRVWAVTQGAVGTGGDDAVLHPEQAQVWGVGRVIALEHPDLWGGLVDLPTDPELVLERDLAAVLGGAEDQVALRPEGVYGRRLVRAGLVSKTGSWRARGTVLITGGTGGLASHVARWMAAHGAEHLVLASRRGPDAPGAAELREELEQLGVDVTIAACDVADRDAFTALLGTLQADGHVIRTVVHTAGVVAVDEVAKLDPSAIRDVLAAKVRGAILLDELLVDTPLDAFVLFSSNAGVWGSGGQAPYAAANAFLDGFADWRRTRGRQATSIAWGAWAGAGMVEETNAGDLLQRQGVRAMDPELAVAALVRALESDERFLAVADVDWSSFAPIFTAHRPSPLIGDLDEVREALSASTSGKGVKHPLSLGAEERFGVVLELVRECVAVVLGFASGAAVEVGRAFRELGLDSLTAVELRNRLGVVTGLRLPVSVVFDYPNAESLAW